MKKLRLSFMAKVFMMAVIPTLIVCVFMSGGTFVNLKNNIFLEIQDIKNREEQKRKREERWEIAQAQGCSYAEWLNQEELSQKSIEFEENEERKRKYGIY